MGGLANSRHAPPSIRNGNQPVLPPPDLIVTPAPTGGGSGSGRGSGNCKKKHHNKPPPQPSPTSPPSTTPTTATTTTTAVPPPSSNIPPSIAPHPTPPPPAVVAPAPAAAPASTASAAHELARYSKIMRRLQWKLPFLAQGYRLAVDRVGADPARVAEAELMFKLDFFEYYMLIERAVVHLLGVFGVTVGGAAANAVATATGVEGENKRGKGGKGLAGSKWGQQHRYHANVLAALNREESPLHGTLGAGEVRVQLGRAKDLRNRWKTAADDGEEEEDKEQRESSFPGKKRDSPPEREWRGGGSSRRMAAPLDTYRLEYMLEVIFKGFDEAFAVAERHVRGRRFDWAEECDTDMTEVPEWDAGGDDEAQWEFMVEAMDWQAV
ncbi:hypothetical protein C8A05DRAFT_47262 [Staphylotrichum tortipilum]|uniref:Uncharacterized protein n=1 Tax=Staphylotrichum tortipilum TaxID=2831512 RepID=A0AAN6RPV8_9PEZI|nr:hypothetical protein C8A05DRAFT_47262 [Staphylotrichum longicolle]